MIGKTVLDISSKTDGWLLELKSLSKSKFVEQKYHSVGDTVGTARMVFDAVKSNTPQDKSWGSL